MHDGMNTNAGSAADDDTLPETCETQRLDRRRVVLHLLAEAWGRLQAQPDGKVRRGLLGKLESLQLAVDRWDVFTPMPEQVSAMLEMLARLQDSTDDGRSFWGH